MCSILAKFILLVHGAATFADEIHQRQPSHAETPSRSRSSLSDSSGEDRCLHEINLPLVDNQHITILARQNFTNNLTNEVLKILLMERLGYVVSIENVTETIDILERARSERNIISLNVLDYPEDEQVQTEKNETRINILEANKTNRKYIRIVSDKLPFIVHKIVQNLEVNNSKYFSSYDIVLNLKSEYDSIANDNVFLQNELYSRLHETNKLPHSNHDDKRRVSKACDWIKANQEIVNKLLPRVVLKIAIVRCLNSTFDFQPHVPDEYGLSFDVYDVICSAKADHMIGESFEPNVIGILAPKPFVQKKEIDIPIIFYDTDYVSSEYLSVFPYTLNDISYEVYKFALCDFMESLNWSRIAIISDGSEFSTLLNDDMVPYLHERKILYKIEECSGTPCNFSEILQNLIAQDARIIFANVDEMNIFLLARTMKKLGLNHRRYVWILRRRHFLEMFNHYFAVSLNSFETFKTKDDCSVSKSNLSLSEMISIYQTIIDNPKASFYDTRITKGWVGYLRDEFKKIFLRKRKNQGDVQTVCITKDYGRSVYKYIYARGEKISSTYTHKRLYKTVPLDRSQCMTDMNAPVYFTPCKDELFIMFPMVFLAFLVTSTLLLAITKNVKYIYNTKHEIL